MWTARVNATFRRGVDEIFFALRPAQAPISHARTSSPAVCLTFDDGPSSVNTPEVLDLLARHDARATFFVVGKKIAGRDGLLQRMVAEGHEIGNHTWSHPRLARDCDDERVREELTSTSAAIAAVAGEAPRRFRGPRYDVDARVLEVAAGLGLRHTHGDVTPPDWKEQCSTAFISTFVLQQVAPDCVIGLHDGIPRNEVRPGATRQRTVDAVARVVPILENRGVECVTASMLLDAGSTT